MILNSPYGRVACPKCGAGVREACHASRTHKARKDAARTAFPNIGKLPSFRIRPRVCLSFAEDFECPACD